MVVGVNGTGKTTTIGKLAWHLKQELGLSVIVAAADTYRAAAIEQLEAWAERAGVEIVRGAPGGDPGAVVFDAIAAAESRGHDVVIADTAGRLHTTTNLMEELAKVRRVAAKRLDGAPHETLIVIDATTGQNGLRQAQAFAEAVDLTGVVLTKLDGTAKGGIALAIASELEHPGEADRGRARGSRTCGPFDAREFAGRRCSARVRARGARKLKPPDVRPALRPPSGDALRRPLARQADRGRRRPRDARDPPRPARGRRQLQGRQGVHRAGAGALPRRGRAREPQSRPAGREDRQRGARRADGRREPRPRLRRLGPDRDPDGRAAGLGQDDRLREARQAARRAGQEASPSRPATPSGRRRSSSS